MKPLKVKIYLKPREQRWADDWKNAMAAGMRRHGETVTMDEGPVRAGCDLMVTWGTRYASAFDIHTRAGDDVLVMERGYIGDREAWTSLAFNGLNGRGEFIVPEMDVDHVSRYYENFRHLILWQKPDPSPIRSKYALILGQVPGDKSLENIPNLEQWYLDRAQDLMDAGYDVLFRTHPVRPSIAPKGIELCKAPDLKTALAGAQLALAYNSNSLVDAVLSGTPAVCYDQGAMAAPVCTDSRVTDIRSPTANERREWGQRLAWCQWSMEEIRDGAAWDMLRTRYNS